MKTSPDTQWQRLAQASRPNTPESPAEAPFGFATRVVATWRAMDRDARFQFWRNWSLRATLAAGVAVAILAVAERNQKAIAAGPAPLQAPSLPLPTLP